MGWGWFFSYDYRRHDKRPSFHESSHAICFHQHLSRRALPYRLCQQVANRQPEDLWEIPSERSPSTPKCLAGTCLQQAFATCMNICIKYLNPVEKKSTICQKTLSQSKTNYWVLTVPVICLQELPVLGWRKIYLFQPKSLLNAQTWLWGYKMPQTQSTVFSKLAVFLQLRLAASLHVSCIQYKSLSIQAVLHPHFSHSEGWSE